MLFLLTVSFLGLARANGQPRDDEVILPSESTLQAVREELLLGIDRGQIPSFGVAVSWNGQILWQEGLGWADLERRIPASIHSRYPVASVSKSITGTGVGVARSLGTLDLNRAVNDYLRESQLRSAGGDASRVLVEHLLDHRSGLPHLWSYEFPDRPESQIPRRELLDRFGIVVFEPGTSYHYSNLNYAVAAEVLQASAGQDFGLWIRENLFEPLTMNDTELQSWVGGQGSVKGYDADGKALPYAFGWGILSLGDLTALISDGAMLGATATVLLVPERALGIVCLTNRTGGPAMETALQIADRLIPGLAGRLENRVQEVEAQAARPGTLPSGRWEGEMDYEGTPVPVAVEFREQEPSSIALGESYLGILQDLGLEHGLLTAGLKGELPIGPDRERTHDLLLTLSATEDGITGFAAEWLIADRPLSGLPYAIRLRQVPPQESQESVSRD